jgi:hypothetical protein
MDSQEHIHIKLNARGQIIEVPIEILKHSPVIETGYLAKKQEDNKDNDDDAFYINCSSEHVHQMIDEIFEYPHKQLKNYLMIDKSTKYFNNMNDTCTLNWSNTGYYDKLQFKFLLFSLDIIVTINLEFLSLIFYSGHNISKQDYGKYLVGSDTYYFLNKYDSLTNIFHIKKLENICSIHIDTKKIMPYIIGKINKECAKQDKTFETYLEENKLLYFNKEINSPTYRGTISFGLKNSILHGCILQIFFEQYLMDMCEKFEFKPSVVYKMINLLENIICVNN